MTGESNHEAATPNDVADVLAPVAVDIAYSYRVPAGLHAAAWAIRRNSARPQPRDRRHLGACARSGRRQSQIHRKASRLGAAAPAAARSDRLGFALDAGAARHGAAHGDARARGRRRAGAALWRAQDRQDARAADAGAPARSRRARRRRVRSPNPRSPSSPNAGQASSTGSSTTAPWKSSLWRPSRSRRSPIRTLRRPALEPDQARRRGPWSAAVEKGAFSAILLEGVTGSGKTEVYFEAVASALRAGRQALILLPEIALTAQFLDRFAARFGVRPAEWHSGVPARRRERLWGAVASGEARVVAGARSALFLPFAELGLIVVDEEHEGAYKQEDGVAYHARDMAVVRARLEGAPIVLASATPSIETRVNAEQGRYGWLRLVLAIWRARAAAARRHRPAPRGTAARALAVAAPDRRRRGGAGARRTIAAVPQPARLCAADAVPHLRPSLPMSQLRGLARRASLSPRADLPSLRPCRKAPRHLPDLPGGRQPDGLRARRRTARGRSAGSVSRRRGCWFSPPIFPAAWSICAHQLEEAARGVYDIIIGTQLVAKGHNFPLLTLVGIVDADVGLANGDPRAAERTFQLLQQATGRAGRGEKAGARAASRPGSPNIP